MDGALGFQYILARSMGLLLFLLRLPAAAIGYLLLKLLAPLLAWRVGLRPVPTQLPPTMGLPARTPRHNVSVVIVSWNGQHLLATCLPALRVALDRAPGTHQVLVVDNGSSDGTVAWLAQTHPWVEVVALPENKGFGEGNNAALPRVRHETTILLNNDMIVEPEFVTALRAGFVDEAVFAVSAQILQEEGRRREETGNTGAAFRRGEIHWFHDPLPERAEGEMPVFWAGGGATAFDTAKLRQLGGFDPLFSPAYVEDADLSWRAWKRGWRSVLAVAARALHRHRSTSARVFTPVQLRALVRGNQWLFLLKNLTDPALLREFQRCLPRNVARDLLHEGLGVQLRVAWRVVRHLAAVRQARAGQAAHQRISDRAILSLDRRFVLPPAAPGTAPHVLIVSAYVPRPGVHAGAQRIWQLLRRLSQSFRISVLAYAETEEELRAAGDLSFCASVDVVLRGVSPQEPNPLGMEPPAVVKEFGNPEMRERIRRHLGSGRYDLVQFEYLQMAWLLPEHTTLPRVLTDHEVQIASLERAMAAGGERQRLRRLPGWLRMLRFELRACRRFDRVVVMTDDDAAALLRYDPGLPLLVNNTGVDTQALQPAPEPPEPRLCFVGYFGHAPNVEAMCHFVHAVLPRIRAQVPQVTLSIIGSAPGPEIQALAAVPGVEVTGRVPDIAPHVHRAQVYVVPLRQGAGIRGKILEAWALGRAVVTTSVGMAGLRAQHGTHLLCADDDAAFAAAVVELLRDPTRRARILAAALQRVRADYSWDAKAMEHARLWRELLDRAGSPLGAWPWRRAAFEVACPA